MDSINSKGSTNDRVSRDLWAAHFALSQVIPQQLSEREKRFLIGFFVPPPPETVFSFHCIALTRHVLRIGQRNPDTFPPSNQLTNPALTDEENQELFSGQLCCVREGKD
jgi:hypothetical protein